MNAEPSKAPRSTSPAPVVWADDYGPEWERNPRKKREVADLYKRLEVNDDWTVVVRDHGKGPGVLPIDIRYIATNDAHEHWIITRGPLLPLEELRDVDRGLARDHRVDGRRRLFVMTTPDALQAWISFVRYQGNANSAIFLIRGTGKGEVLRRSKVPPSAADVEVA